MPNAPPLNGSVLLELDFTSFEPCWLNLRPNSEECEDSGDNSLPFSIDNTRGSLATLGLPQPSATETGGRASVPSNLKQGHNGLSTGASVAIGVGATVVVLALIGGIFALVWLQRKKRNQEKVRQSYNHAEGLWRRSEKPQPLLALEPRSLTHSSRSSLQQLHGLPTSFVAPGMTFSTTPDSAAHIMSGARQSRVGHNAVVAPQDEHQQLIPAMHEGAPLSASMYQPTPVEFYASTKEPSRNPIREANREVSNEPVEFPGRDAGMDVITSTVMHPYEPTELPGKESHRGYGEEYELSIPQHPRPFQPSGHEVQEQKFLLDDIELREMKQQARLKQGR